jgi:uncharacterized protein YqgC (DUF456 family)
MVDVAQLPALPVVALMAIGALVALAGHVTRLRGLIVVGLVLLFAATAGLVAGGLVAYHEGGPNADPRPARSPGEAGF